MKTVRVKSGQTLADIAIQEKGALEALVELASVNGLGITDAVAAGTELSLPAGVWNRLMESYCRNNDVMPATSLTDDDLNAM